MANQPPAQEDQGGKNVDEFYTCEERTAYLGQRPTLCSGAMDRGVLRLGDLIDIDR